jgi:hypothetical protein
VTGVAGVAGEVPDVQDQQEHGSQEPLQHLQPGQGHQLLDQDW